MTYDKQSQLTKKREKRTDEYIDEAKLTWIRQQPCLVCRNYGCEAHHTSIKGMGGRNVRNDKRVVPLCPEHHRGEFSPHGRDADSFYKKHPKPYLELLAKKYHQEYIKSKNEIS